MQDKQFLPIAVWPRYLPSRQFQIPNEWSWFWVPKPLSKYLQDWIGEGKSP